MTNDRVISTVLFDIDGTLVDSNYLHVDAWSRAFADVGHPVETWRIHRAIGMDSAKLLETLLGDDAADLGDEAKEAHSRYYTEQTGRLRRLDGTKELLRAVKDRGLTVVLATSAPQEELEVLLQVLDSEDLIDEVTSSEDVGTAKPEPDLIDVALEKAGVTAEQAVMVGDSVYDIEAAARAGVVGIGVLSGGFGAAELEDAGAVVVYDGPDELRSALAEALDAASAGTPTAVSGAA
jgi:HAD superfamily hydrolase (TIGR01549 family)